LTRAGQDIAVELENTEAQFARKLTDAAKVLEGVADTLDGAAPPAVVFARIGKIAMSTMDVSLPYQVRD
jgi:hypothetical protein